MIDLAKVFPDVIAAVELEGVRLVEEFYRPEGPRGERGHAPIDTEIEERLCAALQALVPCTFAGEETPTTPGTLEGWTWLVDPQDGTWEFLCGRRGSAIAVALLRGSDPVLGVVHSPLAPDLGRDTIAWHEGRPHILRNGVDVEVDLSSQRLEPGALAWATASAALRPATFSLAFAPARFAAMPSIAYRLARVAAGDGLVTLSVHPVNEYDIAAGLALIRAARGTMLDAQGREIVLTGKREARVTGCYAGAPQAARHLAQFDWKALEAEPKRAARVTLGFPRKHDPVRLARAQGCLLGQVVGDALGSLGAGARELIDGGPYHTFAGQPTDRSELALVLARLLTREKNYEAEKALDAYRDWLTTRPVDVGEATEKGLIGRPDAESQSNGALLRVAPLGIWTAADPARAAAAARADCALTHPNPVCLEAAASFAAAIAVGVAGEDRAAMLAAALQHAAGPARHAIERGASGARPDALDLNLKNSSVLATLQAAFYWLMNADFEDGLVASVAAGGDTAANGAVAGALLGAFYGRAAVPSRWILPVLACRPLSEAGALRPRPMECWPDDLLDLAEALLLKSVPGTD